MTKSKNHVNRSRRVFLKEKIEIRCEDWNDFRSHYFLNISEGGLFIEMDQPLQPGTSFDVAFSIANENFAGKAEVIWAKSFISNEEYCTGMGCKFTELDDTCKQKIKSFVDAAAN